MPLVLKSIFIFRTLTPRVHGPFLSRALRNVADGAKYFKNLKFMPIYSRCTRFTNKLRLCLCQYEGCEDQEKDEKHDDCLLYKIRSGKITECPKCKSYTLEDYHPLYNDNTWYWLYLHIQRDQSFTSLKVDLCQDLMADFLEGIALLRLW